MISEDAGAKLTSRGHFFKFWMPYVFQPIVVEEVKWAYLPLNRNYKSLGVTSRSHVEYHEFAKTHGVKFSRDPHLIEGVWSSTDRGDRCDEGRLWLYKDSGLSRRDYFERFAILMSRSLPILQVNN